VCNLCRPSYAGAWQKRIDEAVTRVRFFRDLEAWQASMELAVAAHQLAARLPPVHRFELGTQIRKAATSIPSNVAEGHAHGSDNVLMRHVRIALGSLAELETQVEIAVRLGLLKSDTTRNVMEQFVRTGQLLNDLKRALEVQNRSRVLAVFVGAGTMISTLA
jgi:four helix bundle protein